MVIMTILFKHYSLDLLVNQQNMQKEARLFLWVQYKDVKLKAHKLCTDH